jgi:electron transport complex protein RnfB
VPVVDPPLAVVAASASLVDRIDAALPQTQCTRCGYPDCRHYAQAIANGQAAINQCPPGGAQGIERLAQITGHPVVGLHPAHGIEGVRQVMWIDEDWCIGCTLCLKACPVDAIVGVNKRMHTIIEPECTGCELCLPVCPVDCIRTSDASGTATGWDAWSSEQAEKAKIRYAFRSNRLSVYKRENAKKLEIKAQEKLDDLPQHSHHTDPLVLDKKRAIIAAALARARVNNAKLREEDPSA